MLLFSSHQGACPWPFRTDRAGVGSTRTVAWHVREAVWGRTTVPAQSLVFWWLRGGPALIHLLSPPEANVRTRTT